MLNVSLAIAWMLFIINSSEPSAQEVLKNLQGEWQATSVEGKGRLWNMKEVDEVKLDIVGDVLIYKRNTPVEKFRITLNPAEKPGHINFQLIADGVTFTKKCHGIYLLEGDQLKLCLQKEFTPDDAEDRPTEFKTGKTGEKMPPRGGLLLVLKRSKK